jgi:hypothetical protein
MKMANQPQGARPDQLFQHLLSVLATAENIARQAAPMKECLNSLCVNACHHCPFAVYKLQIISSCMRPTQCLKFITAAQ